MIHTKLTHPTFHVQPHVQNVQLPHVGYIICVFSLKRHLANLQKELAYKDEKLKR